MKQGIIKRHKRALAWGMATLMTVLLAGTPIPKTRANNTYSITIKYDEYIEGDRLQLADADGNIIGGIRDRRSISKVG